MTNLVEYILNLKGNLASGLTNADSQAKKLEGTVMSLKNSVGALGLAFGAVEIVQFGKSVIETGSQIETLNNVIKFSSLDAQDAAKNHEFLNRMIQDYKLPLIETTEGYSQFSAALMGSSLQGEKTREIFEGVSTAVTGMHLSGALANQVFLALNQMVSKGTVQSQEMRLQLGNALPGAFQIAARAAGVTTDQFSKMMEQGEVISSEFLPKFAATLKEQFSGAIPNAILSTQSRLTEMRNSFIELKDYIFTEYQTSINSMITSITDFTKSIKDVIGWIQEHKAELKFLIETYLIYKTTMLAVLGIQQLMIWYHGLSTAAIILNTLATEGLSAAWVALNIAMYANPIGLIIAGIAALIAGVVALTNHFGGFKNMITGVWSMIKSFAVGVGRAFMGMGEVIMGALTFNPALVRKGLMDTVNAVRDASSQIGATWQNASGKPSLLPEVTVTAKNMKKATNGASAAGAGNAVSGTKAEGQKTINIHVAYNAPLIQGFTISTTNIKEGLQSLKEQVSAILVGATHDTLMVADY